MAQEITDTQRVAGLKKLNPKLSTSEACTLLGINFATYKEPSHKGASDLFNKAFGGNGSIFDDIFKKK